MHYIARLFYTSEKGSESLQAEYNHKIIMDSY
jgi:hypothetical protein